MAKIAASFNDAEHADAVVAELARMNIDGLDWRVDGPGAGGTAGAGVVPVAAIPGGSAGTGGVGAGDGRPLVAAPFIGDAGMGGGSDDGHDYLQETRGRGSTVITVDVSSDYEDLVRQLFERHDASNVTTD